MKRHEDKEWALSIGPDTVRIFIDKAKAISAALSDEYEDGHDHEVELDSQSRDSHHHDGLAEEESENLTARELKALIDDLNVDEAAELVALTWIGRGDFEVAEWSDALAAAKDRNLRRTSRYLLGMPMLGNWLEDGLDAIGA